VLQLPLKHGRVRIGRIGTAFRTLFDAFAQNIERSLAAYDPYRGLEPRRKIQERAAMRSTNEGRINNGRQSSGQQRLGVRQQGILQALAHLCRVQPRTGSGRGVSADVHASEALAFHV